jgi:hypothetical protein
VCLLRGKSCIFIYDSGNSKSLGGAMAQAVICRLRIAVARARSQTEPCESYMLGEVNQGQDFIRLPRLSFVTIILPMFRLHLHSALTRKTNGRSRGTFQKLNACFDIGKHWIVKLCYILFKELN